MGGYRGRAVPPTPPAGSPGLSGLVHPHPKSKLQITKSQQSKHLTYKIKNIKSKMKQKTKAQNTKSKFQNPTVQNPKSKNIESKNPKNENTKTSNPKYKIQTIQTCH